MRDHGRQACYRAEWTLGEREQLAWSDLMALATKVLTDATVKAAYSKLAGVKLRPVHKFLSSRIGQYDPAAHRVTLYWGGRDDLTLLHELAHAATPGHQHGPAWRAVYLFLAHRFLDHETAMRLTAAFADANVIDWEAV